MSVNASVLPSSFDFVSVGVYQALPPRFYLGHCYCFFHSAFVLKHISQTVNRLIPNFSIILQTSSVAWMHKLVVAMVIIQFLLR